MERPKQLIGVIDEPGPARDALAETIARDGLSVVAVTDSGALPPEVALAVAHVRAVPAADWPALCENLPTLVVSDSRDAPDLLSAVDAGLVNYIVEPRRHGQLLRRMIRKAIRLRALEEDRRRDRLRLEELNETLETHLAMLRLDQQAGGQIQRRLLPSRPQTLGGVTCDYWFAPYLYLSGDFLDFHLLDERHVLFYFADVSGHGASSAFVTVLLKYLANRWQTEWDGRQPETLPARWLADLNRELLDTGIGKHATLFVGIIDLEQRYLHYSLGAQLPMPLLVAGGKVTPLAGEGMPVGLFPGAEYPTLGCSLPEDFHLWLCSDGVLECLPGDTLDSRLRELEQQIQASTTLADLRANMALDLALGDEALPDDLTILMLSGFGHADS
ncbi:MAG: serine/threonine-protein phosphatase [Halomonas sp.]|uniref:PP2C family protein-serine/threonine phosphatase n=1 Tax=Halomonas sp. TaxID=1486246 RepID=UPI001821DAB1|nr:PP2C family protein-serine/threonine phosphatase [Halomonas sp.]NWN81541.1 serine/threonine-protein phosphatase [Halomonas sp.]